MEDAPAWAVALELSSLGLFVRQSAYAYPIANLVHLFGLILLVGPIALFDLRVLGLGRGRISLEDAYRLLTPFATVGLVLLASSGALLFAADARSLTGSTLLIWKLVLVALGVANAIAFGALWRERMTGCDVWPPALARLQAAGSIALWLVAASLGRLIAYA